MKYTALLRGINVGGNRKVEMKKLKAMFESLGYTDVSTYLNSGNVIFSAPRASVKTLRKNIETAIKRTFGFEVVTLVLSKKDVMAIVNKIPKSWQNDKEEKTDVAFLFPEIDSKKTLGELPIKKEFINIHYVKRAIFWRVKRKDYNKSHLNKIIAHKYYQMMTVRNINTARALAEK